jgi:hypothetical protein
MSDYNQRQYWRMIDMIDAFERDQKNLGALVDDLYGLLLALEGIPDSWINTFQVYWGNLELERAVRAVALHEGSPITNDSSKIRISDAISRLKLMILDEIDDPIDGLRVIGS